MIKQQGMKLFIVLLLSTLFIYSFSHFGALAYEAVTSDEDVFLPGTTIGSVDVSGQAKIDAVTSIADQIQRWQNETKIDVQYKEKLAPVNLAIFQFDIQGSIDNAQNGQQNPVLATIDPNDLDGFLMQLSANLALDDTALTLVKNELLAFAQNLIVGQQQLSINQIIQTDAANETISENTLSLDGASVAMMDWVEGLSPITVPAKSQVSFVKLLEENQLTAMPNGISSVIASAIYRTILSTNFDIVERHIGQNLPAAIDLGYEAKINTDNHLDFVFGNPNDTEYKIELQWSYPELTIQLKGNPFLYKYEIVESDKQEFKPKTIIQYSPQLLPAQKTVKEAGKPGYLIKITRKVYGEKGELLREEIISEDFYAPIEKVEVHGLTAGTTSDGTNTDTTGADNSNENDQETTDSTVSPEEPDEQTTNANNNFWGKPNETEK